MTDYFHSTNFDDATRLKLEIYRRYLQKWLPVFITSPSFRDRKFPINVFDFFCGPGHDAAGTEGSPILALRTCLEFSALCREYNRKINLYFNDADESKIATLKAYVAGFSLPSSIEVNFSSLPFSDAFPAHYGVMSSAANLIFIDQYGVKEVTEEVFMPIAKLDYTDLLFFTASWHAIRFKDHENFRAYIQLPETAATAKFKESHRVMANYFRQLLPEGHNYHLAPFSLKKKSSVHGLIFGSNNLLGIAKFMEIAWDLDPRCGEANFDIDNDGFPDSNAPTQDMFASVMVARKVELFQKELEEVLRKGRLNSDLAVFTYTLDSGFLPVKHAKPVLMKLIKERVLVCKDQPRLSKTCIKEPRAIKRAT